MLEPISNVEPRAGQIAVDLLLESLESYVKNNRDLYTEEIGLDAIKRDPQFTTVLLHRCFAFKGKNNAAIARGETMPTESTTEINRQPPSPKAALRLQAITDRMYWISDEPSEISSIMVYHAMLDDLERWNNARPEETSPIRIEEVIAWLGRWISVIDILIWRRDHGAEMPSGGASTPSNWSLGC